jgi:hypothetical protein
MISYRLNLQEEKEEEKETNKGDEYIQDLYLG